MPLGTVKSRTKSAFQRLRRELALEDTLQEAIR
jgi:DNA-directed RNA polymerase specialized sigma24 family protein